VKSPLFEFLDKLLCSARYILFTESVSCSGQELPKFHIVCCSTFVREIL